ncbi:tyrosyl-tRNA synthetase [Salmonella enterica subsp. enterica]|uniref:Tyrosyl-tRNA synthetase n=1 Tax=Salmonella enterica I TaxID=59201 RepID=A0A3S4FWS3_SALET|nr:tyrosyl-tRNA synthetase [Salmonella enterica subsp. enterica]
MALEEEDKNSGKAPRAQYVLAEQVTRLVHGEEGLVAAKRITECLFSGSLSALSEADFEQLAQDGVPMVEMEKRRRPDAGAGRRRTPAVAWSGA